MPNGKNGRKNPFGFAWLVLLAATAASCQRPVVQRVDPLPVQPGPMLDRAKETNPLPPPPPQPAPQPNAPTATGKPPAKVAATEPETPPPTPILDSYVQRGEMLKQISLAALGEPESKNQPQSEEDPGPRPKTLMPPARPRIEEPPAAIELPPTEKPVAESSKPSKEPATINPDKPAEPPRPRDVWGEGLESLRVYAHDREKHPDDSRDLWALRARVLDWMAESRGNEESARLWRTVLTPLTQMPGSAPRNEHARASEIRAAIEALEDELPLEITDLRLCRKVSGFGIYEPLPASACKAGRPLILYCEMSGLRYTPSGDSYRSRLAAHVEVLSAKDGKSVWKQALGTAEDLCRRRRDYFVNYRITLPATLPPGQFELRLTQTDLVSDRSTTLSIPLTVHP